MNTFDQYESNVRSYCRVFPDVFSKAENSTLISESGKKFIDFWAGAGALNYGHNNPYIIEKIISYLQSGGILHALDLQTVAKREFIEIFQNSILKPKNLNFKIQFCGPTGTNGVEASFKLARKVKKRQDIFSFTGSYHGMTLGSLAATSGNDIRNGAGVPLNNIVFFPYPGEIYKNINCLDYMETVLSDDHSGISLPAAVILETLQAEGGVNAADIEFLRKLRDLCDRRDILLICDDVQVGCYRTGPFFSFEKAGITPDIVILSKSISGCGFPMSILLMKPELDIWNPGEHNGTFRGYQPALIGAKAAIEFSLNNSIEKKVAEKEVIIKKYLEEQIAAIDKNIKFRGTGMIWGIDCSSLKITAKEIASECYKKGLVIEKAGRNDSVLKIMPPLTIDTLLLKNGLDIIRDSLMQFF